MLDYFYRLSVTVVFVIVVPVQVPSSTKAVSKSGRPKSHDYFVCFGSVVEITVICPFER